MLLHTNNIFLHSIITEFHQLSVGHFVIYLDQSSSYKGTERWPQTMRTCDAVNLISRNENALEYFNFKNFPRGFKSKHYLHTGRLSC